MPERDGTGGGAAGGEDSGGTAPTRSGTDEWWRSPALARTWQVIAARLEQLGLVPSGRVTIDGLTRAEQRALSDLVGRDIIRQRVQVDLVALDERLRSRAKLSLLEAAGVVAGRSLVDRPSERVERRTRRDAPRSLAMAWAAEHPEFPAGVVEAWVDSLARDGVLARDSDAVALVADALAIVASRWAGHKPMARTELAVWIRGDAHALDDDRRLSAVALRLIATLAGDSDEEPDAMDGGAAAHRRLLWERIGVLADRVSSTCLIFGVERSVGSGDGHSPALSLAGPSHLTWWDLDRGVEFADGQRILVCENPRVLEAAAEIGLPGWGVVCTSGRPSLVTSEVLSRLRVAGAEMRYHGDFDWPGITMANDLVDRFEVRPWRMSADDYSALPAQLPLGGVRVDARWDLGLAPAMVHRGLAVHEEATLPDLFVGL